MKIASADKLFINELKDLYSAEKQITGALPKMAKAATSEELRTHSRPTWNKPAAKSSGSAASSRW